MADGRGLQMTKVHVKLRLNAKISTISAELVLQHDQVAVETEAESGSYFVTMGKHRFSVMFFSYVFSVKH